MACISKTPKQKRKRIERPLNFEDINPSRDKSFNDSIPNVSFHNNYDDEDELDAECLFYGTTYVDDGSGEDWVHCIKCKRQAHEFCEA